MLAAKGLPPKSFCLKTSILANQWELIKNSNSEVFRLSASLAGM